MALTDRKRYFNEQDSEELIDELSRSIVFFMAHFVSCSASYRRTQLKNRLYLDFSTDVAPNWLYGDDASSRSNALIEKLFPHGRRISELKRDLLQRFRFRTYWPLKFKSYRDTSFNADFWIAVYGSYFRLSPLGIVFLRSQGRHFEIFITYPPDHPISWVTSSCLRQLRLS